MGDEADPVSEVFQTGPVEDLDRVSYTLSVDPDEFGDGDNITQIPHVITLRAPVSQCPELEFFSISFRFFLIKKSSCPPSPGLASYRRYWFRLWSAASGSDPVSEVSLLQLEEKIEHEVCHVEICFKYHSKKPCCTKHRIVFIMLK